MERKIKAPAVAMLVAGILGIVLCLAHLVSLAFSGVMDPDMLRRANLPRELQELLIEAQSNTIGELLWAGISLAVYGFITFAGVRMLNQRSWGAALTGSILLMIPCFTPCCCTCGATLGIGIWALIVLLDAQVKQAFKP